MKRFAIGDIRKHSPCYDPTRYLPPDWTGDLRDILIGYESCPLRDRIWVVCHLLDTASVQRFAKWCAHEVRTRGRPEQAQHSANAQERAAHGTPGAAFDAACMAALAMGDSQAAFAEQVAFLLALLEADQ